MPTQFQCNPTEWAGQLTTGGCWFFLFVYLQIIKSMWRVGMCEKNCRLSSLKLDCLSKKTLFSCSKLFRTESWPQGKAEKTEFEKDGIFNYLKKGAASIFRGRLFFPEAKDTRNIILHCSLVAAGVTFVSALSAITLITTVYTSCPPHFRSCGKNCTEKYLWSWQPHAADPVWFCWLLQIQGFESLSSNAHLQ